MWGLKSAFGMGKLPQPVKAVPCLHRRGRSFPRAGGGSGHWSPECLSPVQWLVTTPVAFRFPYVQNPRVQNQTGVLQKSLHHCSAEDPLDPPGQSLCVHFINLWKGNGKVLFSLINLWAVRASEEMLGNGLKSSRWIFTSCFFCWSFASQNFRACWPAYISPHTFESIQESDSVSRASSLLYHS